MKSGICPKCNGTDVRVATFAGNRCLLLLSIIGRGRVPLQEHICPDCGYIETYVQDVKSRQEIIRAKCAPVVSP